MKIIDEKFKYKVDTHVCGLTRELIGMYIANYYQKSDENIIILTSSLYEANNFYKILQAYINDVLFFPMDDFLTSVALAVSPDLKIKRLDVIEKLKEESKNHIVVTSLMGYLKFLPNMGEIQSISIDLGNKNISREIILDKLIEFGYKKESLVTSTGEYALRGYILDIFPLQATRPIRIEFFDNEIETIREFDENTQRTIKNIKQVTIKKYSEEVNTDSNALADYMKNETVFYIDEQQIINSYTTLLQEINDYNISKDIDVNTKYMYTLDQIKIKKKYKIDTINGYEKEDIINYNSKELLNFDSNYQELQNFVKNNIKTKTIIFMLKNDKQIKIIMDLFSNARLTNKDNIIKNEINVVNGEINKGFIFGEYILISPFDIDNVTNKKINYKNTIRIGRKIKSYNDLSIGDYVVHESYGIGIYNGLKTLKSGDYEKDYIQLCYLGNDKVYVSVEKIDKLYKYSSKEGIKPKINKLNSPQWNKKKIETRKKINDITQKLIELYTNRSKINKEPYRDYEEEIQFAFSFPYTLTPDQEKSINEINASLKKNVPMDRLLCGDVGYGKTEVAFRAMFKTVLNGYQVAYLCPTTILSSQQYHSALERFKDFPINIALLNRHVSAKKVHEILEGLEKGTIDIVIGTHKLLNDKIKYKKLGMLVIDEEQRFGVSHKEKIKEMKQDVNVLTLSATPIPRTLKMAMSGLRELSILDTPPVNRYPIQTYVIEENDLIIKDAIYKELTRDGQVFILINNIEQTEKLKSKLNRLIPEASIEIGHGQMSSEELNNKMENFINKKFDVLICTTIIETGIDIPNVNTIIIIDADRFGLSQLYQIRGRVGRSDKIAYAYLMYNPRKILTETAIKRLNSIKEFTELGSGYKIAMRDLAIRGAGDILGSEQAGFIDAVGIDLYTKMINQEIRKINGEIIEDNDIEEKSLFNISTHIKDSYVSDESIKIEIHKLISTIKSYEDLEKIKSELEDRFGKIDKNLEIYMIEKCLENLVKELNIKRIIQMKDNLTIYLPEQISDKLQGDKLFLQIYNISPHFKLEYRNKEIKISVNIKLLENNYIVYIFKLLTYIHNEISTYN